MAKQTSPNIANLRNAMMEDKDYEEVRRLCGEVPEGPLQIISSYDDTVLHMAAHSKQEDLVLDLLNMIPEDRNHKLSHIKNSEGNTILHELASSNDMEDGARELLKRAPNLLTGRNNLGEESIFCAARHGQTRMFRLLAEEMKLEELNPEESKAHLQRNDGTTVLHVSVATECFYLALFIVEKCPYLVEQRDQSSMTALQYLACNPTAFRRGEIQIRQGFMELLNKSKFLNKSKIEVQQGGLVQLFSEICEVFFKKRESNDRHKLRELVKLFKKLIQGIICLVLSVSMMAVAFGATIVLMMSHNRENVFWSVVAFLPVPIFFLSYSPLRSVAMGPCRKWFKFFIVYFLVGVAIVFIILPLALARILSLFFDGLGWAVRKACLFIICKPLCWICGRNSASISDTESV